MGGGGGREDFLKEKGNFEENQQATLLKCHEKSGFYTRYMKLHMHFKV